MQTCDVAVIGGGIVGAACAYELASSGLRVAVVGPSMAGAGATNEGLSSLSILDEKPGQFALTRYGLALWSELTDRLPRDCEYRRCGTVWVALTESEMEEAERRVEFFGRQGVHAELLDSRQMAEAEPGLRPDAAGGYYVAGDGCMRVAQAAEHLFRLALQEGAQHLSQRAETILEHEVQLEDGSVLYAGSVVNAIGEDAPALIKGLPVEYSKGHLLTVETAERCARHHICGMPAEGMDGSRDTVRFEALQGEAALSDAREVWIGSTRQAVSEKASPQIEARIIALVLRRAIEMLPGIGQAKPQRSWATIRMTTADGLPLIGRLPEKEGLFVAGGHADYGATAALATARLIADEILLRTPEIDPAPYQTKRFTGKTS